MDARRVIEGIAIGAAAGLAASWLMSEFQSRWKATSGEDRSDEEPNTVKAADAVAETAIGEPVPEEYRKTTGTAVHYGFGALLGAVYGAAVELRPETGAGFGTVYGAAVSLIADELAVPALGLSPPAQEVPASAHIRGFVSHLVFGAALEGSRRLLRWGIDKGMAAAQPARILSTQAA